MCWTYFKAVGHCLKNFSPSQKTLRPPGVPSWSRSWTHCTTTDKLVIPNSSLAGSVLSRNHGVSTFVHKRLKWSLVDQSPEQSETEWLCVDVSGYKNINVYKPPRSQFTPTAIPTFPHPSLYVGDINCQHVNRGYKIISPAGESLDSWVTSNNLGLLHDPTEATSFTSHRWNVGTNPDLAFASFGQDSRLPDKCILGNIPAITTSALPYNATKTQGSCPQPSGKTSELSQCWLEALWPSHIWIRRKIATSGHTKYIERAYQDFCESLLSAAKQCIPRGRRKNCVMLG